MSPNSAYNTLTFLWCAFSGSGLLGLLEFMFLPFFWYYYVTQSYNNWKLKRSNTIWSNIENCPWLQRCKTTSYFILSYLILSCLVLSYLILLYTAYLILSYPMLSLIFISPFFSLLLSSLFFLSAFSFPFFRCIFFLSSFSLLTFVLSCSLYISHYKSRWVPLERSPAHSEAFWLNNVFSVWYRGCQFNGIDPSHTCSLSSVLGASQVAGTAPCRTEVFHQLTVVGLNLTG